VSPSKDLNKIRGLGHKSLDQVLGGDKKLMLNKELQFDSQWDVLKAKDEEQDYSQD